MARTAPERTSRARSAPSTFGSCSSRTTASFRPSVSASETIRNGATTPRGSTSATFVRRVQATSAGESRARYSPIWTTAVHPVGRDHDAAHARRPRRRASPTRRGAAARAAARPPGGSSRAGRSPARGGRARAARRAAPGRRPAASRGRASCRPAGRPGRCAGCRTPARGTCAPPRGSGARSRAAPCAGAARAAPAWPPPPPRGVTYFSSAMRSRTWLRRAWPGRGARSGSGAPGSGRCRR